MGGGDDTIFVILDDRDDVWLTESEKHKTIDGKPSLQPVDNLLKIPAYYYHEEPNLRPYTQARWFEKEVRKVCQICDFDITLIIFLGHLKQVHSQFFNDFDEKDDCLKDTKYYIRKLKNEIFCFDKIISFEHLIPKEVNVANSFEGMVCENLNLARSDDLKSSIE